MKIEFSEKAEQKELSFDEATGVLADSDGEIWLVDEGQAFYMADGIAHYTESQWIKVFKNYSPFTKYNGVVTISN